ncbi:MAG TPA: hypothetical protein VKV25_07750 [Acidimicrobiales bacterium]|nr:hypothetical protein [Acidimicrobiales bacterium]
MPDEALNEKVLRLERAVILLQAVALHADSLLNQRAEREVIEALGEITAAMAAEHKAAGYT